MSSSSFSLFCNAFGLVVGGISILGFITAACRPHLPRNKIKTLKCLLHETENIFKESTEAELLVPAFIRRTNHRLAGLKEEMGNLQGRIDANTPSLLGEVLELFSETSTAIRSACRSVEKLKAEVLSSSEERRRQLRDVSPGSPPPILSPSHEVEYIPTPSPPIIPRPPPALLAFKSRDLQRMSAENNVLRTDSGVRSADVQM